MLTISPCTKVVITTGIYKMTVADFWWLIVIIVIVLLLLLCCICVICMVRKSSRKKGRYGVKDSAEGKKGAGSHNRSDIHYRLYSTRSPTC